MDLRQLTPDLAVSGQIQPEDVRVLAEAGFRTLIDNRPDDEVTPDVDHSIMRQAADNAGLEFHYIPFHPGEITQQMIADYAEALAGAKPALAYCRSGNRSTVLWALANAHRISEAELMETGAKAGYDLSPVLPLIRSLAG